MALEATLQSRSTNYAAEIFDIVLDRQAQLTRRKTSLVLASEPRDTVFNSHWYVRAVRSQRHKCDCMLTGSKRKLQRKLVSAKLPRNNHFHAVRVQKILQRLLAFRIGKLQIPKSITKRKIARGRQRF